MRAVSKALLTSRANAFALKRCCRHQTKAQEESIVAGDLVVNDYSNRNDANNNPASHSISQFVRFYIPMYLHGEVVKAKEILGCGSSQKSAGLRSRCHPWMSSAQLTAKPWREGPQTFWRTFAANAPVRHV